MSEEDARKVLVEDVNYFGVMLGFTWAWLMEWYLELFTQQLQQFVQALQIIKTRPNVTRTSGAIPMARGTECYLFGDCAININPDAEAY